MEDGLVRLAQAFENAAQAIAEAMDRLAFERERNAQIRKEKGLPDKPSWDDPPP